MPGALCSGSSVGPGASGRAQPYDPGLLKDVAGNGRGDGAAGAITAMGAGPAARGRHFRRAQVSTFVRAGEGPSDSPLVASRLLGWQPPVRGREASSAVAVARWPRRGDKTWSAYAARACVAVGFKVER